VTLFESGRVLREWDWSVMANPFFVPDEKAAFPKIHIFAALNYELLQPHHKIHI
jgi:hypothetical protein